MKDVKRFSFLDLMLQAMQMSFLILILEFVDLHLQSFLQFMPASKMKSQKKLILSILMNRQPFIIF